MSGAARRRPSDRRDRLQAAAVVPGDRPHREARGRRSASRSIGSRWRRGRSRNRRKRPAATTAARAIDAFARATSSAICIATPRPRGSCSATSIAGRTRASPGWGSCGRRSTPRAPAERAMVDGYVAPRLRRLLARRARARRRRRDPRRARHGGRSRRRLRPGEPARGVRERARALARRRVGRRARLCASARRSSSAARTCP